MITLTRAQRIALHRVYQRGPRWFGSDWPGSYRAFRRRVVRAFGDAVMVPAAGMMLGIESDGYTHT